MGEKYVQEEFLGEESLGEKSVQEEFLGEESLGEKYMGEMYWRVSGWKVWWKIGVGGMLAFVPPFSGWWILKIHSLRGIAGSFRRKSKPDLRLWTQREQDTVAHIGLCLGLAVARLNSIDDHCLRYISTWAERFLPCVIRFLHVFGVFQTFPKLCLLTLEFSVNGTLSPGTQHIPAASQGHLNSLPQEFVVGLGPLGSC